VERVRRLKRWCRLFVLCKLHGHMHTTKWRSNKRISWQRILFLFFIRKLGSFSGRTAGPRRPLAREPFDPPSSRPQPSDLGRRGSRPLCWEVGRSRILANPLIPSTALVCLSGSTIYFVPIAPPAPPACSTARRGPTSSLRHCGSDSGPRARGELANPLGLFHAWSPATVLRAIAKATVLQQ
jgi:hypothetical protein